MSTCSHLDVIVVPSGALNDESLYREIDEAIKAFGAKVVLLNALDAEALARKSSSAKSGKTSIYQISQCFSSLRSVVSNFAVVHNSTISSGAQRIFFDSCAGKAGGGFSLGFAMNGELLEALSTSVEQAKCDALLELSQINADDGKNATVVQSLKNRMTQNPESLIEFYAKKLESASLLRLMQEALSVSTESAADCIDPCGGVNP